MRAVLKVAGQPALAAVAGAAAVAGVAVVPVPAAVAGVGVVLPRFVGRPVAAGLCPIVGRCPSEAQAPPPRYADACTAVRQCKAHRDRWQWWLPVALLQRRLLWWRLQLPFHYVSHQWHVGAVPMSALHQVELSATRRLMSRSLPVRIPLPAGTRSASGQRTTP